jgi:branched-chain amino acid transport system permease protein
VNGRARLSPAVLLSAVWPLLVPAVLLVIVITLTTFASGDIKNTANLMLIDLLVVLGLFTFSGQSGVLSFGHVSFMSIGAYGCSLLTIPVVQKQQQLPRLPHFIRDGVLPTIPAILAAAGFAMILGYLIAIPLMRLSGLSAGIATLSLLVIVEVVISHWNSVTRGQLTLVGTPTDTTLWGSVGWVLAIMTLAFLYQRSRNGLRLRASREDLHAARSIGVDVGHERRIAFTLSAGMAAVAGGLYGHLLGTFGANTFYFDTTFITLAMLVVGGITSLAGAVVGTIVVASIAQAFRQLEDGTHIAGARISLPTGSQEIVLAALLLLILLFRPHGIMGGHEFGYPRRLRRLLDSWRTSEPAPTEGAAAE